MKITAENPDQYIDQLPEDRKSAIQKLRKTILDNLPKGFSETISYGMISYVIPHSMYPNGYHCDPKQPLPFISLASQKNFISLYHMGIYADKNLLEWFVNEYPKYSKTKLDMGKGCIRFKKIDQIPYALIGQLATKISADEWVKVYEMNYKSQK